MNKLIIPAVAIGGGLALVVILRGGGGGATADQSSSIAALASGFAGDLAKLRGEQQQQQKETTAALGQQASALSGLSQTVAAAIRQQQQQTTAALQQQQKDQKAVDDFQNEHFSEAVHWAVSISTDQQKAYDARFAAIDQQMAQLLALINKSPSIPSIPPAPPAPPPAPVVTWTRDNGPEAWLRSFGGLKSYGGPLSGPSGERWHSSDVWKFYTSNNRPPTSPQEFIAWATANGLKPH